MNIRKQTTALMLTACLAAAWSSCQTPRRTADTEPRPMPASIGKGAATDTVGTTLERRLFNRSTHLNDLIDTVLANNFDLRIAEERIRLAGSVLRQARAPLFPQVNGVAVPSLRRFGLYTMDGAGNIVTDMEPGKLVPVNLPDFLIGTQASWEVDLWGKLKNRKKAALSRFYASEEARQMLKTVLVAETATAYYDLLAYDQELRLLDETIRLQRQALEMVRIQKQTAVTNELAVQQFEVQLLDQLGLRTQVEQRITDTETLLNLLAGRYAREIPRDSAFFEERSLPELQAGIPTRLLLERPDVRQARLELDASDAELEAARLAFLPTLNLTGGLGLQGYRMGLLFRIPESIAYSLIAGLSAPLVNRNMLKGEYGKSLAGRQEALWNYRKSLSQAFLEVQAEMKRTENLRRIYETKRREAEIISSSVSVSDELFRYGRANYVEVLLARQNALRVNIELIETRRNQFVAAIRLYRLLGGGRE
jgi:NodT family efflux transporter outer membrane factor (OMF) lipoprotein